MLSIGVAEDPTRSARGRLGGYRIYAGQGAPGDGMAFGTVTVGKSLSKNVTVYNYGSATLTISESISGTNSADFAVTGGTCTAAGGSLAGGANCNYKVTFTPSNRS